MKGLLPKGTGVVIIADRGFARAELAMIVEELFRDERTSATAGGFASCA